jgi:nitroreductase
MDLFRVVKERRSVRRYTSEPVSDEHLDKMLEAGRWAPSWANTQCARFVVVQDATKDKLAGIFDSESRNAKIINSVPAVIVICGVLGQAGFKSGESISDKGDWYMFDTALATQNMMLTAHDLGLGTVAMGLFDAPKVAELLEIPSNISVVLLLPVGHPDGESKAPPRKELGEIAFQNKYSEHEVGDEF